MDDEIFKRQKKTKGSTVVESAIQSVNEHLKGNRLGEAINVLKEALRIENGNYDLVYLLGVCHIFNTAYEEAITIFESMLKGKHKKNVYLLLSVCYKKSDRLQQTEHIVSYSSLSSINASINTQSITRPIFIEANSSSSSRNINWHYKISIALLPLTQRSILHISEKAIVYDSLKDMKRLARCTQMPLITRRIISHCCCVGLSVVWS